MICYLGQPSLKSTGDWVQLKSVSFIYIIIKAPLYQRFTCNSNLTRDRLDKMLCYNTKDTLQILAEIRPTLWPTAFQPSSLWWASPLTKHLQFCRYFLEAPFLISCATQNPSHRIDSACMCKGLLTKLIELVRIHAKMVSKRGLYKR